MAYNPSYYAKLKAIQERNARSKRDNSVNSYNTQKQGVENTYADLAATLAKRKADLASKNQLDLQNLNTQLQQGNQKYDTQLQQGDQNYTNQRDQGVVANNNLSKQIMDWYAKNNIANSTGSADEMGRQATALGNTLGAINTDKNKFDTGIAQDRNNFETGITNNRNAVNLDYTNNLNDISNQDTSGQREKAQKIAEILAEIQNANNTYGSEVQSAYDTIDAQQLADEQAAAAQAAQVAAARARSSSSRSRSSSSGGSYLSPMTDVEMTKAANQQLKYRYNDGNALQWLRQNEKQLRSDLGNDWYDQNFRKAVAQTYQQNVIRANAGYRVAVNGGGRELM